MCIVCTLCFSQERVNRGKVHYCAVSELLKNATGWMYNETLGEWVDFPNCISDEKEHKPKFKSLSENGYFQVMYGLQNFNTIQAKAMMIGENKYYVIVINKWEGGYEYSDDKIHCHKKTSYWLMTKDEYEKLFNLTNDVSEIKYSQPLLLNYNNVLEEDYIFSELQRMDKKKYSVFEESMQVYKATDGSIRFWFHQIIPDITKRYFETTKEEWNKLKVIIL